MGNFEATKQEVKNHLFARVPLIIIRTSERERVERMMRIISQEMRINPCSLPRTSSAGTGAPPS